MFIICYYFASLIFSLLPTWAQIQQLLATLCSKCLYMENKYFCKTQFTKRNIIENIKKSSEEFLLTFCCFMWFLILHLLATYLHLAAFWLWNFIWKSYYSKENKFLIKDTVYDCKYVNPVTFLLLPTYIHAKISFQNSHNRFSQLFLIQYIPF